MGLLKKDLKKKLLNGLSMKTLWKMKVTSENESLLSTVMT